MPDPASQFDGFAMAKSEGGNLFSTVAVFVMLAAGGVYAIGNRDAISVAISKGADVAAQLSGSNTGAVQKGGNPQDDAKSRSYGDFELKANDSGHFETPADINGAEVDVMVDTGATLVAMTYEDAEKAGLSLTDDDFSQNVNTANGVAKIAVVNLDSITIGDITVKNVKGAVAEPGRLHKTLLGMSFLGRLSRVEMQPDTLILHE